MTRPDPRRSSSAVRAVPARAGVTTPPPAACPRVRRGVAPRAASVAPRAASVGPASFAPSIPPVASLARAGRGVAPSAALPAVPRAAGVAAPSPAAAWAAPRPALSLRPAAGGRRSGRGERARRSRPAPGAGFTLIELLIVVAIIAILAAIAVPNFLEAQTRSKLTRCLADMRSMRTAAESYMADHSVYPRMSWGGAPYFDEYEGQGSPLQPIWGTFGPWVTTPVAYLTTFDFMDPFTAKDVTIRADARLYTYQDLRTWQFLVETVGPGLAAPDFTLWDQYIGAYALMSLGPDVNIGSTPGSHFHEQYDPTNGTISAGNIWRSQKNVDTFFMPNLYP